MCPALRVPWWMLLLGSIVCEVAGTASLGLSEGFTRPLPVAGVLVGYAAAIVLFARVLDRGVGLGVAYGTATACGLLGATALSVAAFGERMAWMQLTALVMIVAGLFVLQLPTRRPR